ncbi:interferon-induced transmembrane protein 1-like [Bos indicus]|uniref:Interferon-induced transmembrane protein 1-like n=1 Tax=Bos indicus TaxID=9915 RepID=A0ABM4RUN5_BOSIN
MFSGEQEVAVMGGPAGSAPMKNAVINIQTENPGRDHIVWSLFNTLFMNICCLGFVAFDYSVESKDQKMVGDITGAQSHASTAKCLNVWALVLGLLLTITFITVFGTGSGPRFSLRVRVSHSKEAAVAVRGRHRVLGGRSRLRPSGGGPAPPPAPPLPAAVYRDPAEGR